MPADTPPICPPSAALNAPRSDLSALLAALILARRSGDTETVNATLTQLAGRGLRIMFGDALRSPSNPKYPSANSGRRPEGGRG